MIIFTDSSADLSREYMEQSDVNCLELSFTMEGKSYPNLAAAGMTIQGFYDYLRGGGMASTSQINVIEYVEAFRPVLEKGEDLVYIGLSGGLSSSYVNAVQAAEHLKAEFPNNTAYILSTRMASMGVGLVVKHAVMQSKQGKSCAEFYQWFNENRMNFNALFTVDDLDFLRRGGRLKNSTAILGSLLKIKPVLNMDEDGHLIAREKARGRKGSLNTLVERMKQLLDTVDQPMLVSHGDALEDAQNVVAQLKALGVKDVDIGFIGPVIGAHSGPGTIALFFLGKGSAYPK